MATTESFFTNPDFASGGREKIFRWIVILIAVIFIGRLAQLQIIKGSAYKIESEAQAIKQDIIEPFRGNMFDRNGNLIVHNAPSFTVRISPLDFRKDRLPLLASILDIDSTEILKIIEDNKKYSKYEQVRIDRDVDFITVAKIEEYNDMLPGVEITVESKRLYDFKANMAHFLGYTREISREQIANKKYYTSGDVIGQSGIESNYEDFLRGSKGINWIAVNRSGKKISSFNKGKSDVPVGNGFDLYLTIDKKLQEKAEELLSDKLGALVAIDPNNGEILAMASKPDYDPRKFSGKIPADIYRELDENPGKPLLNRAMQAAYPPGSTFKMMIASAALQEGIITENTVLNCPGSLTYGGHEYKCHGGPHGGLNVRRAIQASCNVFFYQVALKLGLEKFGKYGKLYGFGDLTHIDIPNENHGILPTIEWLERRFGGPNKYPKGNLVNYGIGQGEINVTPLQMAVYVAALANKGTIYQPHLVRAYKNNILNKMENFDYGKRKLPIDSRVYDIIQDGMYMVVNVPGGTAGNAKIPGIKVCGKTGTAQNPHGQDHSWFICFAPMENPKIAVACIVENAGFGATVAAPIARDIIDYYLNPLKFKQDADRNKMREDSLAKLMVKR